MDEDRQWFKARHGWKLTHTARDISFCQHVVTSEETIIVPDAREDARFAHNPLVTGELHLRAYAGAPLLTSEGHVIGTLCVLDNRAPRKFSHHDIELLEVLADSVMAHLETRKALILAERRQEELAAMSLSKSNFLSRTSHELRTPMSAIVGYTELLQESLDDGEVDHDTLASDLNSIQESSRHLVSLLDDLLDLAKIEADQLELSADTFHISEVLNDLKAHILPLAISSGNRLDIVSPPPHTPAMVCDRRRLLQVLINLSVNAIKFTHHGEIGVGVTVDEGVVCFRVQDTGDGMRPEQITHLFDAFRQASSSRGQSGVGLGLAICKELVTLMEGAMDVTSILGQGSCFTCRIPLEATY